MRALTGATVALVGAVVASAENPPPRSPASAPIRSLAQRDAAALLLDRAASGKVILSGSDREILQAVLHELGVPIESQMLVFSRTSLQAGLIRPGTPRALYFSESAYVGWVPGGLIEVAAIDPRQGPIFYAFDPQDARDRRRTFVRESSCLRCHGGGMTERNPALFARSLHVSSEGEPLRQHGSDLVAEQTPFEERWGGWYVTGYAGTQHHRGNAFSRENDGRLEFTPNDQRPMELSAFFDTSRYPAATSDVVALLIFEHQMAVQNSLVRAERTTRAAIRARTPGENLSTGSEEAERALSEAAEDVLDHLLFRHAAALPNGISGRPDFARVFTANAPRSAKGDSLKDLSLRSRLFVNRCSFLIHSDQFSALPPPLKERIFDRLIAVLHEDAPTGRYAYLEREEKRRIREILTDTHAEFQQRVRR